MLSAWWSTRSGGAWAHSGRRGGWGSRGRGRLWPRFRWTTCGFFLIHLAHPWGYTTGCWMPWAWGLGWSLIAPGAAARPAYPFLLALVLVLQLLPGHFQLAFLTQCGLVLMIVWAAVERFRVRRRSSSDPVAPPAAQSARALAVVLALAWAFPLAALQLGPTARLANWPTRTARIRVFIRLCVAAISSGQLRGPRVVPSLAAVAAAWSGIRFMRCPRSI